MHYLVWTFRSQGFAWRFVSSCVCLTFCFSICFPWRFVSCLTFCFFQCFAWQFVSCLTFFFLPDVSFLQLFRLTNDVLTKGKFCVMMSSQTGTCVFPCTGGCVCNELFTNGKVCILTNARLCVFMTGTGCLCVLNEREIVYAMMLLWTWGCDKVLILISLENVIYSEFRFNHFAATYPLETRICSGPLVRNSCPRSIGRYAARAQQLPAQHRPLYLPCAIHVKIDTKIAG